MKLGEKLRYLREVEGNLRGLDRAMTQQELVKAIRAEIKDSGLKASLSQSYLSQIESGARPHLTNTTRQLLAKFFKVHPGYLVDDPDGYHAELLSDARTLEDKLDLWLVSGAERFRRDAAAEAGAAGAGAAQGHARLPPAAGGGDGYSGAGGEAAGGAAARSLQ